MKSLYVTIFIASFLQAALLAQNSPCEKKDHAGTLRGITHYGMPIEEKTETYRRDDCVLEIIYAKDLSDDNMDTYVQRFYDELLRGIEQRMYGGRLPAKSIRIVISNCKFCKVGYCKTRNIKGITLTSYRVGVEYRNVSLEHRSILLSDERTRAVRSAIMLLID